MSWLVFVLFLFEPRRRQEEEEEEEEEEVVVGVSGFGWFSLRAQILVWWSGKKLNGGVKLHLTPDGG